MVFGYGYGFYIWLYLKYKIKFFLVEDFWGMKENMLVLIVKVLVIFWNNSWYSMIKFCCMVVYILVYVSIMCGFRDLCMKMFILLWLIIS